MRCECFADAPYPTILKAEHGMGGGYAGRAGLYRVLPAVRWKTIDGIPAAMDADTGEETAIRSLFLFLDPPKYYTISKQSLCAFLEVSGGAESRVQVSEK